MFVAGEKSDHWDTLTTARALKKNFPYQMKAFSGSNCGRARGRAEVDWHLAVWRGAVNGVISILWALVGVLAFWISACRVHRLTLSRNGTPPRRRSGRA